MIINISKMQLIMLDKGWNYSALAKESNVSRSTISAMVNGKKPNPPTLRKLAAALNVSPAELVEEG